MQPIRGTLHFHSETGTEGGLWAFMEEGKKGYDALHILENGDNLKIFSKELPDTVVWSDVIQLDAYDVSTEHAFGFWIHADQRNVSRNTWAKWFFNHHPAELIPAKSP